VRVTFNALAEQELNDAARYYEVERAGLGGTFITDVQRCCEAIATLPLAAPVVRGDIRQRLCHRFPYAVLYSSAGDEIRVLAVMHLRRRPGYWVGRR
jgi:plasmid stabilization system protein ParE